MDAKTRIGDYEIVRLLGKGGMSEVYEVENVRLGSRHALKLFTYEKDDPDVRERFLVEGKLLAKLSHPRIVKVTDVGTEPASGRPYFVMDLVLTADGAVRSLGDVAPGTADEEEVGRWYDDLREGLQYIHAQGVIHRDLKLQNVLIGPDGHVVLTDFGISKVFDPEGEGNTIVDTVNTIVKMKEGRSLVMGSVGYMAPELEMGVAASPASDFYALGVIIYRLLTGSWCDSRTDVLGMLDTYDEVWKKILPNLLHSNPNARQCASYADEKRAARERAEFEAEERWLKEKRRGHLARHLARFVAGFLIALLVVGAFVWQAKDHEQARLQRLAASGGAAMVVPSFDELFRMPAGVKADEIVNEKGEVVMPARSEFEAARVDALVLTYGLLDDVRSGRLSIESAIAKLELMRDLLREGGERSVFDGLSIGGGEYMQMGDDQPLMILIGNAIEKLQALEEDAS